MCSRIGTHISKADILDEGRVDVAALADLLEQGVDHVLEAGVLEAALLGLGQGRADGEGDDNVVGVFGLAARGLSAAKIRMPARRTYTALSDDPGARCRKSEPMRSAAMIVGECWRDVRKKDS
jgi:hypothetical protein